MKEKNKDNNKKDSKAKIKIYKRHKDDNNIINNSKKKSNKKYKINKTKSDDTKEVSTKKIPNNIIKVISSKTLNINEEQKKDPKKEIRVLKFNRNKSLLHNKEINKVINSKEKNKKNKKSLSITETPKNLGNKSDRSLDKKLNNKQNDNNDKSNKKNKSKRKDDQKNNEKNLNLEFNKKNIKNESKSLKNIHIKIRNKKNEIYSPYNNDQKTNPIFYKIKNKKLNDKKHIFNNINNKNIYDNKNNNYKNIEIKSDIKRDIKVPKTKNRKISLKKRNSINSVKSNGKESSKVQSANKTINCNSTNSNSFKILSHRPFNAKNIQTMEIISKRNILNNKSSNNNLNPRNLKLSHSNERNKSNGNSKIFGKLIRENSNKNFKSINRLTENGKINNNNEIMFKTIKKHINKLKNKNHNILNLEKYKLKENINNDKKDIILKKNLLKLNRAKSNIFIRKTTIIPYDFNMKLNNQKNRKNNNDIFIYNKHYTKHYGDHNKCPLCQSMEMKAKFSENKIGIYRRHSRAEIEDSKICTNYSSFKTNFFPAIKSAEEKNDVNDISVKKEMSPIINLYGNQEHYFRKSKEQFAYNILKNKGKLEKLGINDFPVLDKYFNS